MIEWYLIGVILSPFIGLLVTYFSFKNKHDIHEGEIGLLLCVGAMIFTMSATFLPLPFMS